MAKKSDHFDGKKFFNPYTEERTLRDVIHWMRHRHPVRWPKHVPVPIAHVQNQRVESGELWVTFIGHSTTLIQLDGLNILTDPIWSKRASPFSWAGPKRVTRPGINFEDLPPIDIVLISHNHYDHLDLPTLKKLQKTHHPDFYTSLGNKKFLESKGIKFVAEMDWWETTELNSRLNLTFVPAQHFAARTPFDRDRTLWGGFVLKGAGQLVYFAGDTGYSPYFKEIRQRLGTPTFSLLPIGAYLPRWFMKPVHMSPGDAVQAHLDLGSKTSMGIHFGTFQLTDEGFDQPVIDLKKELQDRHLSLTQFWALKPGEGRKI